MNELDTQSLLLDAEDIELRFHQSEVFRFSREALAEELLSESVAALNNEYLPSGEIRFTGGAVGRQRSWPKADHFADISQAYVDALSRFDKLVRNAVRQKDIAEPTRALMLLVEVVTTAAIRGWNVNWRQNVQWALRGSRYGLSSYSLVQCFENLNDRTTLSERLEIIGCPIFYRQNQKGAEADDIEPVFYSGEAERHYEAAFLSLNNGAGRRYLSDWIEDEQGARYRLLSD